MGESGRREIALFELGHEPGSFEEPLPEKRPGTGRVLAPKKHYLRAAAVVAREKRREKKRSRRHAATH
jgi:hypothetical protein